MYSPMSRKPMHGIKCEFVKQEAYLNPDDKLVDELHTYAKSGLPWRSYFLQQEIAQGKWLALNKITYKDAAGQQREWEAVNRTTNGGIGADAVVIIPILKRLLKYDCVILVKQYRPPLKAYSLEFPAGLIDKGEVPEETALRELKEETGYFGVAKHCSPVTCLDPGVGNCTINMVTVEIDGDDSRNKTPEPSPSEDEFIEVYKVPLDSLLETLNKFAKEGVVVDSRVYSYAIAMEQTKRNKALVSPVAK